MLSSMTVDESEVVDAVDVALELVLSATTVDDTDEVSASDDELSELASLVEEVGVVNDDNGSVVLTSDGVDDGGVTVLVEAIVEVVTDVAVSGGKGEPVPSQYRPRALGPPHTCDASPVHAM